MEEGIQRELRTLRQVVPVDMPGYFVRVAVKGQYVDLVVQPDTTRRLGLERTKQIVRLRAQLLTHTIREIQRQHTKLSQIWCKGTKKN